MNESRLFPRRRTLRAAKLLLSSSTLIDCQVRDISDTGARLEFPGPTQFPREFRLQLTNDRTEAPAELAWQLGLQAGVRFKSQRRQQPANRRYLESLLMFSTV